MSNAHTRVCDGQLEPEKMTAKRKQNWNAGLTKAQKAIADQILDDQIAAFDRERGSGAFGALGSVWEIAPDGTAQHRGLSPKELAIVVTDPASNVVLLSAARRKRNAPTYRESTLEVPSVASVGANREGSRAPVSGDRTEGILGEGVGCLNRLLPKSTRAYGRCPTGARPVKRSGRPHQRPSHEWLGLQHR